MNNTHRSSKKEFLLIGDSHAKYFPRHYTTLSYRLTTQSTSGLKWHDYRQQHLSLYHLLVSSQLQYSLSNTHGILLFIGTNSLRFFSPHRIISEIKDIIIFLRATYPQLNQRNSITIPLVFPCRKTNHRFPTHRSLRRNIELYNQQLQELSIEFKFHVINFHINRYHLARDGLHVHRRYSYRIFSRIKHMFYDLVETLFRSPTATNSIIHSPINERKSYQYRSRRRRDVSQHR